MKNEDSDFFVIYFVKMKQFFFPIYRLTESGFLIYSFNIYMCMCGNGDKVDGKKSKMV